MTDIKSGEYLTFCNELKDVFDKKNKECIMYKKKYNNLYKEISVIYGLIRCYQSNDDNIQFFHIIDEIRTICSNNIFEHLEEIHSDEEEEFIQFTE